MLLDMRFMLVEILDIGLLIRVVRRREQSIYRSYLFRSSGIRIQTMYRYVIERFISISSRRVIGSAMYTERRNFMSQKYQRIFRRVFSVSSFFRVLYRSFRYGFLQKWKVCQLGWILGFLGGRGFVGGRISFCEGDFV